MDDKGMANFRTHMSVAATASCFLSIGLLKAGFASEKDVLLYFSLGSIGGILPDIDSDHSIPSRFLFGFFALVLAFLATFHKVSVYSILELSLLWAVVWLLVRFVVWQLFAKCTIHRGVFHSLLAATFFGCLTTGAAYHIFQLPAVMAWTTGSFVCIGYLIHLVLDELYSVDLVGAAIKKSFGTALKPFSLQYKKATLVLCLATAAAFYMTPKADTFVKLMTSTAVYQGVKDKILPKDRWFK
jgi:hypothetical protein